MSGLLPAAVYGLEIPNGDVMVPAMADFPASFRITMAAIDPSATPEFSGTAIDGNTPRATLKLIRQPLDADDEDEDSEDDSEDEAQLRNLIEDLGENSEEDSEDDEGADAGPSDPSKSKKARSAATIEALKDALANGVSGDDDMEVDKASGKFKGKGKAVALGDEDSDSEGDSEDIEMEEFVICTLDPTQHYQQPLDITVGENERVYFKVSGTHTIFLTGNYVLPVDDTPRGGDEDGLYDMESDDEEDYDLSPYDEELDSDESDELDGLADPRITELGSDDEEVPQLVKNDKKQKKDKKGNNKRSAPESDEEAGDLDAMMDKSLQAAAEETKLSKKQQKKLKNNDGKPVKAEAKTETESPSGKKVQFAKNLEQGPTGTKVEVSAKTNGEKASSKQSEKAADKAAAPQTRTVKGVKIEDRKVGQGKAAKKGDRVGMRYIGKLKDGKQFDANKKGKPFIFKLGANEVIQGWEIGLEGVTVGGERRLVIPANLAYGKQKIPGIPPNSELTFDVKCLSIN